MSTNIECQLHQLQRLTTAQLRQRFREIFGKAVRSSNKSWLIKRIAWRLQALAEGDLCETRSPACRRTGLRCRTPPRTAPRRYSGIDDAASAPRCCSGSS